LDFLKYLGLKADVCTSEDEAIKKSHLISTKTTNYPIYFFGSDTSGEKSFEEFYTEEEILDFKKFNELGVIKNSSKRNIDELNSIFNKLNKVFSKKNVLKNDVVKTLKSFLPNFDHIETGKNLDQKM
jgi:FlaA1/EpsC-like NDP-sugar epimerase